MNRTTLIALGVLASVLASLLGLVLFPDWQTRDLAAFRDDSQESWPPCACGERPLTTAVQRSEWRGAFRGISRDPESPWHGQRARVAPTRSQIVCHLASRRWILQPRQAASASEGGNIARYTGVV